MTPEQLLPTLETPAEVLAAILAVYLRSDIDDPDEYVIELCAAGLRRAGLGLAAANTLIERIAQPFLPLDDPLDWDFLAG